MRHLTVYIFGLLLLTTFCGQTDNNSSHLTQADSLTTKNTKSTMATISTIDSNYVVLQSDSTKHINLSVDEIKEINKVILDCINNYNPEQEKRFNKTNKEHPEYKPEKKHFVIDLDRYKRQYIISINDKGQKEIWVNCFCSHWDKDWKKKIIMVKDGGNCYFQLKINLTTKKYFDFSVNGVA